LNYLQDGTIKKKKMHIKKITQEHVKKGKVLKINSTIAQIDPKNLPVYQFSTIVYLIIMEEMEFEIR